MESYNLSDAIRIALHTTQQRVNNIQQQLTEFEAKQNTCTGKKYMQQHKFIQEKLEDVKSDLLLYNNLIDAI